MESYEIAYHPNDPNRVALGAPGGPVAIMSVGDDGAPDEVLVRIHHHRATPILVRWWEERLVTMDAAGRWAVFEGSSGALVREGQLEGEYLHADVADGALFVTRYAGDCLVTRVDLGTGDAADGPAIDEFVAVSGRVFALDAQRALVHVVDDDWETDRVFEGVVRVDCAAGSATLQTFEHGPSSDFDSDSRLFAIDRARGLGARPDPRPIERTGTRDEGHALLRLEIFDLDTLEVRHRPVVLGWPRQALEGPVVDLETAEPGSEEYANAQEWMMRRLCSAVFVRDTPHVWVGMQQGMARRVSLEDDTRSAVVIHGGGADTGPPTLDDVFARNLMNLRTLACSPDGRFVAFGNPNDFFCVEHHALDEARPIRLPMRGGASVTEAPHWVGFAGGHLIVFDQGCGMYLVDPVTGEPRSEIPLPELYGEPREVAASPDGRYLAVAVAAGESFVWDTEREELLGTGLPPHMLRVLCVGPARFVFTHHEGAVAYVDLDAEEGDALRAGEDEGDAPDTDFDAFEQRWGGRGATFATLGGAWHALVLGEGDDLQLYQVDDGLEVGPELRVDIQGRFAGGPDVLIAQLGDGVKLLSLPDLRPLRTLDVGSRPHLCVRGDRLFAYDDDRGHLYEVPLPEGEPLLRLTYEGPGARFVDVAPGLNRVVLATTSGEIELLDLEGDAVAQLAIHPIDEHRRELLRVTE